MKNRRISFFFVFGEILLRFFIFSFFFLSYFRNKTVQISENKYNIYEKWNKNDKRSSGVLLMDINIQACEVYQYHAK